MSNYYFKSNLRSLRTTHKRRPILMAESYLFKVASNIFILYVIFNMSMYLVWVVTLLIFVKNC